MTKEQWEHYCHEHLATLTPLLARLGFALQSEQPHIAGERYLLSGPKLVLFGEELKTHTPVVIKVTDTSHYARELAHECACRSALHTMNFAYQVLKSPREILFGTHDAYTLLITEYIPQEHAFLERTLEEQFFLALKVFEAQEASHATTHGHVRSIRNVFDLYDAATYEKTLTDICARTHTFENPLPETVVQSLITARATIADGHELIDRYAGFLTHWDLVPHNFRIRNNEIYLLDHTAIRFGNKYDGWARFMNFMTLYHPELEAALDTYVRSNRRAEEHETLRLMRMYRLSELVWFYASKRSQAEGPLRILTEARINLWSAVLQAQLTQTPVSKKMLADYRQIRDTLRDPSELKRQVGLH